MQNLNHYFTSARGGTPPPHDVKWGGHMKKAIISLVLALSPTLLHAADAPDIRVDAPERYTVVEGDTLWSISGRYLKSPWRWPQLWNLNSQVPNPHRIYPGDVLVLQRGTPAGTVPVVAVSGGPASVTLKLEPRIRIEQRPEQAVPAIPPKAIEAFLAKPLVVGEDDLSSAPRIVATEESRVALGAGNVAYVEGITEQKGGLWHVFRRGDVLTDPESGENLGYVAIHLGEARVRRYGEVSTVEITKSSQEIYEGDRLLPAGGEAPSFGYAPHAPRRPVSGRVLSAYGGLGEAGPLSILILSKGSRDGLEPGHVLALHRDLTTSRNIRTEPLWGRSGPSGSDAPGAYYVEPLRTRDSPVFSRAERVAPKDLSRLPVERYGLVMVFRSFERAAFALVMEASRPVSMRDVVTNP